MKTKPDLPDVWRDKDGNVWLINEMSDDHLLNSITFLRRNAKRIYMNHLVYQVWNCDDDCGPDPTDVTYAQACAWLKTYPQYRALVSEGKRRKKARKNNIARQRMWLIDEAYRLFITASKTSMPDPEWHGSVLHWMEQYRDFNGVLEVTYMITEADDDGWLTDHPATP